MKIEQQLQVQAYLDNELNPAEARKIAGLISTDTDAQALYRELKDTKEIVTANEPVLRLQEGRDFYWSQIQRQIAAQEKVEAGRPRSSWLVRWVAPLAGACALIALSLSLLHVNNGGKVTVQNAERPTVPVQQLATETFPSTLKQVEGAEMSTITFRSESEGMTVVWISNDI